jgi:short-subunit dehydrogenase
MSKPLALITGASSGIGYEIALDLADRGYDILATGRDATRLQQLQVEARARSKCQVHTFVLDLGAMGQVEKLIEHWKSELGGVEVLVNNAGFGVHGPFATSAIENEMELVRVQIETLLRLTKEVLKPMMERKHGWVLNVGSIYSFFPVPFQSVYGACKVFMLSFSEALSYEAAESGVVVSTLCPGTTITAFRSRLGKKEKTMGMTAQRVAQIGCSGLFAGKRVIVPGLINRIIVFLSAWIPSGIFLGVLTRVNRYRGVNH